MCEPKINFGSIATGAAVTDVLTSKPVLAVAAVSVTGVAVYSLGVLAFLGLPFVVIAAIVGLAVSVNRSGVKPLARVTPETVEAHRKPSTPRRAAVAASPVRPAVSASVRPVQAAIEPSQPDVFHDPAKVLRLDPADVLVEVARANSAG